jgi:O-methyltransferase
MHLKKSLLLLFTILKNPADYFIYRRLKKFTMISPYLYMKNIALAKKFRNIKGAVVECGTWRGGMIAGIATKLGNNRSYFLYDSFEGLPPAKEIDGLNAIEWQGDKTSAKYFDNCKAEMVFAENAMKISGVQNYKITKGWFSDTLPLYDATNKIAILRLDGDWYESTMDCLVNLYQHVEHGGVVIMDDYHTWDGCTLAVHDFLSQNKIAARICQYDNSVCYWVKI